jgi:DDE superfamily endonuclease
LARASSKKVQKEQSWFSADFGVLPVVVVRIWEDLQTTNIAAAKIHSATIEDLSQLLYTLHLLKVYPTEEQRQNKWHRCDRVLRDNSWDLLLRLQALKEKKIVWPTAEEIGDNIFIGSVDGTHVKTEEPSHPRYPKDTQAFSHKNQAAGLSYEICLSLSESKIIWINGPFPASIHDATIFDRPGGLKEKLQGTGLRLIGDYAYRRHRHEISYANSKDSPEVSKFKTRARMRHEHVNAKLKTLRCVDGARFRHKGNHGNQPKFKIFFEAACVVTQYKIEMTDPLFDI